MIKPLVRFSILLTLILPGSSTLATEEPESRLLAVESTLQWEKLETFPLFESADLGAVCLEDDSLYAQAKATGHRAININNATSAQGVAQWFDAPEPITISGFSFYAFVFNPPLEVFVTASLYLADGDLFPTGAALASVTVPISNEIGGGTLPELHQSAVFVAPIEVSTPYVVVVENHSPNGIALLTNDYSAADGAQEWLASLDLFGTWTSSEDVVVGGDPFDSDWLFEPKYSVSPITDFTAHPPCVDETLLVDFTNTSSAVFSSRFYNQNAFYGTLGNSFDWAMGDGTTYLNTLETSHSFGDTGPHEITLDSELMGWQRSCLGQRQRTVGPVADYYPDVDEDGFGDSGALPISACEPEGMVVDNTDCDDFASSCTDDCTDIDLDTFSRCIDLCTDPDFDDYGIDMTHLTVGSATVPVGLCMSDPPTPCALVDEACIAEDTCLGDDGTGDIDGDNVCADNDCDDNDPDAQDVDLCGVCGGDGSSCLFNDGFESGDTSRWSSVLPLIGEGSLGSVSSE